MFLSKMKIVLKDVYHQINYKHDEYEKLRNQTESLLNDISKFSKDSFEGTVLIDAGWDNPNYWLRLTMIRAALGLHSAQEIGLLGPFRRKEQRGTLKRISITNIFDYFKKSKDFSKSSSEIAKKLYQSLNQPEDILKWSLPFDIPPDFLYDYILKRQKYAFVKIDDVRLINRIQFFLNCAFAADYLIKRFKPKLVISSHAVGWLFPLVWVALKNKVKVIFPYGDAGVFRFWQINQIADIYNVMTRPTHKTFLRTSEKQKILLQETGKNCLRKRLHGKTDNLGAIYAYSKAKARINKIQVCTQFGWDGNKRIVAVYASNWFDFPHTLGMSHFRDFHDWIMVTLEKAKENKNVNWLFKAHPCDQWYGGITLKDIINVDKYDHIQLVPGDWNGAALIEVIDAIVTYHGTIGLEATATGKPVLVADKGWYEGWGFVKYPHSREEYLQSLDENWWEDMDLEENAKLAQIFAGWYWGRPSWQKDFLLEDDSRQWEIYKNIPNLLENNKEVIGKEIETIRSWFESSYPHYHTYKMMQTDKYIV